ncbi:E3 ubiquitin-protein ligase Mdm2 isoform X2 [Diachasma alloeum]|uniref:E3 ubiquitin-protein ligase Mdm2 isoform X2 n=1 Tax=Diachasma alloeum TaxID=454923 RepID=UPI000738240D|nr:E3 ubiquitin-protein ligase Mdm2 isoform X2 [Diachasma alloeum]
MSLATPLKRSASASISPGVWEARGSDEDGNKPESKKPKYSWYVTLESETPDGTSEDETDNESVYSVQGQETEYARDTSDTSTNTWISTDNGDVSLQVEYEVASMSESDNPFLDSLTSSDPEDVLPQGMLADIIESDLDPADNSDDSRSSIDSEIGRADYWTCLQCSTKKNNPLFPYCEKCFQIRKNFYPPRPKWKRQRSKKILKPTKKSSPERKDSQEDLVKMDSGLGSSQGSQSISEFDSESVTSSQCTATTLAASPSFLKDSVDSVDGVPSSFLPLKTSSQCSTPKDLPSDVENKIDIIRDREQPDDDGDNKNCNMCTVNPKDGVFVHGKASHICCCYRCAVKTWKTTKYCPICNRKVTNVLKVYIV